jgi:V8-like Glu-specific endopeptidase
MRHGPILLGVLLAALLAPAASAAEFATSERTGSARDALEYWTPERIERAGPPPAEAAAIAGSAVAAKKKKVRRKAPAKSYVSQRVPDPRDPPFISTGRLLGRIPGVGGFGCSGTVVRSPGRSLVLTAAHCLFSAQRFADTLIFIPAYRNDQEPYGRWATASVIIPGGYPVTNDPRLDYGAAVLAPRAGVPVEDAVGGRKVRFDTKRRQTYRAMGYPANKGKGKRLWSCRSKALAELPVGSKDNPVGIGCNMTFGASGGPWIGNSGDVVSVTSVLVDGYKNYLFGPRLGSGARNLLDQAGAAE